MKEGAIIDSGTHDQLMSGDNEYATLIKMFYTQEKEEEKKPGTVFLRFISLYEPRHEKTCLRDLRSVKTQTGLLSYRS